jgi:hypothetical protein
VPIPHWEEADGPTECTFVQNQDFKAFLWEAFMPTTPEVEAAMAGWLASNRQDRFGRRTYALDTYDVTVADLEPHLRRLPLDLRHRARGGLMRAAVTTAEGGFEVVELPDPSPGPDEPDRGLGRPSGMPATRRGRDPRDQRTTVEAIVEWALAVGCQSMAGVGSVVGFGAGGGEAVAASQWIIQRPRGALRAKRV